MELINQWLKILFPRGRAWRLPGYWHALLAGWATAFRQAKSWLEEVKQQIHPRTSTTALEDWRKTLGIGQYNNLSIEQWQDRLEALDVAKGGQDLVYLNRILQLVYPNCWIERIPSNDVLGNRDARCGMARCAGGEAVDENGQPMGSIRFFYYVKGFAQENERSGLYDLIARLCPTHLHPVWLVHFLQKEEFYARQSISRR
ncbi:DUF2313 domain-containing protein (plasmid) [Entomospira entomophila]|uniref:DUF2313 domain-containing protein n=1 Tax=Entomospira entomophila TaxID=2719988 RepID=A0A968KUD4_9SPIO|nr:DUF2313 domain-containing protein [Entomospira entomophilus]NIZ41356.1 DUF2313 domain-containing protein [Entomospira entomophilus]WDI36233.1 DUF2313 domain-containing protein [Entomospira entomophilus]